MDRILIWLAALALLISPASTALAQTNLDPDHRDEPEILTVDRMDDLPHTFERRCWDKNPNDCTLRDAILRANQDLSQSYRIIVPAGTYTLTIPGEEGANLAGDLDLQGDIELVGAGSVSTIISAGGIDRVMQVLSGAKVKLSGLTLRDGQASPADPGGGIYNSGVLEMTDVVVTHNRAGDGLPVDEFPLLHGDAGGGGGIYNSGVMTVTNSLVSENQAGKGGTTTEDMNNYQYRVAGRGGDGGGILNEAKMTVISSAISNNQAGVGGDGAGTVDWVAGIFYNRYRGDNGGKGGNGGAIANRGSLRLNQVEVRNNLAGKGGDGGAGSEYGGDAGDGGHGGGIMSAGSIWMFQSSISENHAGNPGNKGFSPGYVITPKPGLPGAGGGLFLSGFSHISDSLIDHNSTADGIIFPRPDHTDYLTGPGGGIINALLGNLILENTILEDNQTSGFGGGIANYGALTVVGGDISRNSSRMGGGGIYNQGILGMSLSDVIQNSTGPGYDGAQYVGKPYGLQPTDGLSPDGGGLFNTGKARLVVTDLNNNSTGDGGEGGDDGCCGTHGEKPGDGGSGGLGGGIYNQGELEINLSELRGNRTGKGGQVGDVAPWMDDEPGQNGPGGSGGGIYNAGSLTASYLTIKDNLTGPGFSESEPGGSGGGIANESQEGIENLFELRDSLVLGNRTARGGNGGGISISSTVTETAAPLVSSTRVISNTANASGGGISAIGAPAQLESLIVASNQITDTASGAGIFIRGSETIINPPVSFASQARHLTIAANQGGDGSGLYDMWSTMSLTDTILAGQPVGVVVTGTTTLTMTNTLWGRDNSANGTDWLGAGILVTGTLNLFDDPRFVDPNDLDFHLQPSSPARDTGIDKYPVLDVDAQPRPDQTSQLPDIGADEIWDWVPVTGGTIVPPQLITATLPAEFGLNLAPPDATPEVRCFWLPEPGTGQWTCSPTLVFPEPGEQSVEVWVLQGGSPPLHLQTTVTVQPLWGSLYLPVVKR